MTPRTGRHRVAAAAALLAVTILYGCGDAPRSLTHPARRIDARLGGRPAVLLEPSPRPRDVVVVVLPRGDRPAQLEREPQLFGPISEVLIRRQSVASAGDPVALVAWLSRRGYRTVEVLTLGSGEPESMKLMDGLHPAKWVGVQPQCVPSTLARQIVKVPMFFFGDHLGSCPAIERRRGALVDVQPSSAGPLAVQQALAPPATVAR